MLDNLIPGSTKECPVMQKFDPYNCVKDKSLSNRTSNLRARNVTFNKYEKRTKSL